MRLKAGDRLDRFEIVEPLGEGAYAETYKARDTQSGEMVTGGNPGIAALRQATATAIRLIPIGLSGDRSRPRAPGEGSDALRHFHEFVPSVLACIEDGLVGVPDAVAEKVGPQELPDVFHGI